MGTFTLYAKQGEGVYCRLNLSESLQKGIRGRCRQKHKKFDIQIIWFYKDIDGLVLVTCRLQVKLKPIVKEFTRVNQNNFARNFCKYYSLNSVVGARSMSI